MSCGPRSLRRWLPRVISPNATISHAGFARGRPGDSRWRAVTGASDRRSAGSDADYAGKIELNLDTVDVHDLMRKTVGIVRDDLQQKRLSWLDLKRGGTSHPG